MAQNKDDQLRQLLSGSVGGQLAERAGRAATGAAMNSGEEAAINRRTQEQTGRAATGAAMNRKEEDALYQLGQMFSEKFRQPPVNDPSEGFSPLLDYRGAFRGLPRPPLPGIFESGGSPHPNPSMADPLRGAPNWRANLDQWGEEGSGSSFNYDVDERPAGRRLPSDISDIAFYEEGRAQDEGLLNMPDISKPATIDAGAPRFEEGENVNVQQLLSNFRQPTPRGSGTGDPMADMESIMRRLGALKRMERMQGDRGLTAAERDEMAMLEAQLYGRG